VRTLSVNPTLRHHTHGAPLPQHLSPSSSPTVIVAIIAGTILLIWNDDWLKLPQRRTKMEATTRHDSASFFPSGMSYYVIRFARWRLFVSDEPTLPCSPLNPTAATLVEKMLKYFFASLMPAFRHLRQATTSSLASVAPRRPQPALPLYRPPGFREPPLATPRPAMPRDSSSFRVQSNPYSGSEPSMTTLPVALSPSIPTFPWPAGSPPS
jgi:hypothetical protein